MQDRVETRVAEQTLQRTTVAQTALTRGPKRAAPR